jgi:hypothetical protein
MVWRAGPATHDVTDATYVEETVTLTGKGRRPLSPVHVIGRRPVGTDDIKISWKRRTRRGGDSWEPFEVALGEDTEGYELDILNGTIVARTLTTSTPAVIYTSAQQTADFGSPIAFPDVLSVKVHQVSASFGRGIGAAATLFFPLPVETG